MTICSALPNTLTNGTTADATQVMANENQIVSNVNANAAHNGANSDITSLSGLTTPLSIAQGGTAGATAAAARTSLGVAASGANSDITSLSGLTTALSIAQGGTASTTASAARTALGAAASGANTDITSLSAPALGAATAATAAVGTRTTQVATTAFVNPAQSLAVSGYVKLAGGLIIQWGQASASVAGVTVTFPLAFPTNCQSVTNSFSNQTNPPCAEVASLGTTGFTAIVSSGSPSMYWMAIGY